MVVSTTTIIFKSYGKYAMVNLNWTNWIAVSDALAHKKYIEF